MNDSFQDELWPHFVPLWTDLQKIAPKLLLVGGYSLFLKQQWLVSQMRFPGTDAGHPVVMGGEKKSTTDRVRTLIPINRWKNQTPRVTKDFDFIANLDLIASEKDQNQIDEVLTKHKFKVVPENARWQFQKRISEDLSVILDFHAPSPVEKRDDLRVQSRRVKPLRSLGQTGIHGHENPEAIGTELHPFSFTYGEVEIVVPNPVTLTLMKLTAMRDRRLASQEVSKSAGEREEEDRQARKHAEDVCRAIAMVTLEERDAANGVLGAVRGTPVFRDAVDTFTKFFKTDDDWGSQAVIEMWEAEDFHTIQKTLATWFH